MNGIKRTLENHNNSSSGDSDEHRSPSSPAEQINFKKRRTNSANSDIEIETQLLDEPSQTFNDQLTESSDSEAETKETTNENFPLKNAPIKLLHVAFDDDKENKFRYDGTIEAHIQVSSNPQSSQVFTESTFVRTFSWRLLVRFERSARQLHGHKVDQLQIYVQTNPEKPNTSWHIHGIIEIILIHPLDQTKNVRLNMDYTFSAKFNDQGYSNFKSWQDIYNEYLHFPDHTVRFLVKIHADPPKISDWDSKLQTGFVGLKNIGATCYMNVVLQTVFFIKKFRKSIYLLPTDHENISENIALALQKVFYDLQFNDRPVVTRNLTRSFGWQRPDELCQHDIQEFFRILLEKLEIIMQETSVESLIPSLFQGQFVQYVRCIDVDHQSKVFQPFYDIPLQVRSFQNIIESFRDFCKIESLNGDNMYDAGPAYGLQVAEKGVKFWRLPPILCIQLLRFEYDSTHGQHRKIDDHFEFTESLDLSEFLEEPNCSPSSYKLFSILVHSGDYSNGHYVSFISPDLDGKWFKFDDEIVGRVSPHDALDRNFGLLHFSDHYVSVPSAYMLVYVREDCRSDIFCPVDREKIPSHLLRRIESGNSRINDKDGLKDIELIFTDDLHLQPELTINQLISNENPNLSLKSLRSLKVNRTETFSDLSRRLARQMGVEYPNDIRLWIVRNTSQTTHQSIQFAKRMHNVQLVLCKDETNTIVDMCRQELDNQPLSLIFVEQKQYFDGIYRLLPFNHDNQVLIFVKHYDDLRQRLNFVGHFFFSLKSTVESCLQEVATRLKISMKSPTELKVYGIELKFNTYSRLQPSSFALQLGQTTSFSHSGCTMIVQFCNNSSEKTQPRPKSFDQYLTDYFDRQKVHVVDADTFSMGQRLIVTVSPKESIQSFIRLISENIDFPPEQIIVIEATQVGFHVSSQPRIFSISSNRQLAEILAHAPCDQNSMKRIMYKKLPFDYNELENRFLFGFFLVNSQKKIEREIYFYLKRSSTVHQFLQEIQQWVLCTDSSNGQMKLRLMEVTLSSSTTSPFNLRICPNTSYAKDLIQNSNLSNFFLEKVDVNENENDDQKNTLLIPVAHFTRENILQITTNHFVPFFLRLTHNETFGDVKIRLKQILNFSDSELQKYRFSIYNSTKLHTAYDNDARRINLCDFKSNQGLYWLGLESSPVTNPRKSRKPVTNDKPIRIN